MRFVLWVLLAVDSLQVAIALAAFLRARGSSKAGAPSHARYSLHHGLLLLGGAVVLALPVVAGLANAISTNAAVVAAIGLELAAGLVARGAIERFEAAHQARRPGPAH